MQHFLNPPDYDWKYNMTSESWNLDVKKKMEELQKSQ